MSDRDEFLYIEDMLDFCRKALAYSAPPTQATLTDDPTRHGAVLTDGLLVLKSRLQVVLDRARSTDLSRLALDARYHPANCF